MPQLFRTVLKYWRHIAAPVVLLWVFSWFYHTPYPNQADILPPLLTQDPIQKTTDKSDFEFTWKDKTYFVEPMYQYELWGVIVSYNNYDSIIDPTNVGADARAKDLCVVWGDNLKDIANLDNIHFWNTNYTCWYQPDTYDIPFNGTQLSNNHLISENPLIHDMINTAEIGDQIHLKGFLATYGTISPYNGQASIMRKSSTVRNDTGDGACETIYVTDMNILRRTHPVLTFFLQQSFFFFAFWMITGLVLFLWDAIAPSAKQSRRKS